MLDLIDKILIDASQVQRMVCDTAARISSAYLPADRVLVINVLEGASYFTNALFDTKLLDSARFTRVDLKASSYRNASCSCGEVTLGSLDISQFSTAHVLIIDDIYDTGNTLNAIIRKLKPASPLSIKTCVMISRLRPHAAELNIDFVGQSISDASFLVGCGLDFQGTCRELPFIAAVKDKYKHENT